MTEQNINDAIDALVNWWAAFLTKMPSRDAGLGPEQGALAMLAMMDAASAPAATPEQIEVFKSTLKGWLLTQINNGRKYISLSVDYGPDDVLCDALRSAGLPTSVLPWKTDGWITITDTGITASGATGYGAPSTTIYPSQTA